MQRKIEAAIGHDLAVRTGQNAPKLSNLYRQMRAHKAHTNWDAIRFKNRKAATRNKLKSGEWC